MPHLTLTHLEDALIAAAKCADPDRRYVRAETGKYKPYMPATIKAAERRGYLVEKACEGVFYVYPRGVEATPKTLAAIAENARNAIDAGARNPTPDCTNRLQTIAWMVRASTVGKLRTELGDVLCMNAAPCVKVDRILALVAA